VKEIFKYSNILIIERSVKPELNITIVLKYLTGILFAGLLYLMNEKTFGKNTGRSSG